MSDFSTDFVLEIVARLLNVIYEPEVPFENVKPPPSMSARYKLSSNLAEKCQSLGYDNVDLGTFLYVNETDLRAVLMFLIDKIPAKVEDIKDEEELGANALIRKEIKESLKISSEIVSSDTNDPWNAWEVEEMKEEEMWKLLPKETRNAAIEAKIKLSSLIQHNEELKEGKIQTNSEVRSDNDLKKDQDEGDFILDLQKKEDIENPEEIIRLEKPEIPSQTDKLEALKSKREKVYEEMEEIQTKYKAAKLDLKSKKQELINLHEKFEALNIEKSEKEKNLEKRMKMMELLPSGEENLQKLKDIVAKKKSKILGLQEQFELHKKSILQERDQMKKQIEILKREKYQTNKELTTKEKIQQTKDKIDEQKKFGLKVAKQLEQIPDDYIPRTAYTEQIMDILGKVTKQKSETEKVIEDIKTIQKDINMLEGKKNPPDTQKKKLIDFKCLCSLVLILRCLIASFCNASHYYSSIKQIRFYLCQDDCCFDVKYSFFFFLSCLKFKSLLSGNLFVCLDIFNDLIFLQES